jgi:RNA polymerase sigma-70 factor (ECF subfamily)
MAEDPAGAFEGVFLRLYPRVLVLTGRILGSREDAEDAAAEGFARAYVNWGSVGAADHRDAWICRVAMNAAVDIARKRQRVGEMHAAPTAESVDLRLALAAALGALPVRQREAIVLRHLVGLPEREVAAALNISRNTVKRHLQRGRMSLRRSLGSVEEVLS